MKNSRIWTGALAAGIIACLTACTQPSNTIVPNKPSASLAVITLKDSNTNNPIFSEKEWLTERDCVVSSEIKEFIDNNMSKKYYDASIGNYTEDILWMKTVDGGSTYSKFSTADIIKENTTLVPFYCNYKSTQNIATSVTSADSNGIIILLIKPENAPQQTIDVIKYKPSWSDRYIQLAKGVFWLKNDKTITTYNYPFVENGDKCRITVKIGYNGDDNKLSEDIDNTALSGIGKVFVDTTPQIYIRISVPGSSFEEGKDCIVGFSREPSITNHTGYPGYISYAPHTDGWTCNDWYTTENDNDPYASKTFQLRSELVTELNNESSTDPDYPYMWCQVTYHIKYNNIDYSWNLIDDKIHVIKMS